MHNSLTIISFRKNIKNILLNGRFPAIKLLYSAIKPDIFTLNTLATPFEWNVPLKVSSNIGEMPQLKVHTANLVGNYMIVAFGTIGN